MIQVTEIEGEPVMILINGKKFADCWYDDESKKIEMDDFPPFNIAKIATSNTTNYPDNLLLQWRSKKKYCYQFDYFYLYRKKNKIAITFIGHFELLSNDLKWLIWNPYKYTLQLSRTAKRMGYKSETFIRSGNTLYVTFHFDIKHNTIGDIFNQSMRALLKIMNETNKVMRKLNRETKLKLV